MNDIILRLEPFAVELIIAVFGAVALWMIRKLPASLAAQAEQKWRETEKILRDSLHQSAKSGIEAAFTMGLTGQSALEYAIQHIYKSVPDAIMKLKATDEVLINIINSKIS